MKLIDRQKKRKKRKLRSRLVKGNSTRPRVVLSKSNRYLIAQAINDEQGHTLLYLSTIDLEKNPNSPAGKKLPQCRKNEEWAKKLGQVMANKLKEQTIKQIVFDRNGYPYITKKIYTKNQVPGGTTTKMVEVKSSGKIHAFCETMRQGGIEF